MEKFSEQNNIHQEAGEEQLSSLIKQAGKDARKRKRKALNKHAKMLRAVIAEGISRRKKSYPA